MREPKIDKEKLEVWAGYLIEHSIGGVSGGDRVMIKGERIAWPLIEVLERRVVEAGGVPDVMLVPPNNERGRTWSSAMARFGGLERMGEVPSWVEARYRSMDKYIEILGAEDPSAYAGLSADQVRGIAEAEAPLFGIRLAKDWCLTLFPTPAAAEMEGMDLEEYVDFVVGASTTDPGFLRDAEEKIAPIIAEAGSIEIATEHPETGRELVLEMNLEHSRPTMSYGLRNFPDGEVFTSPDARSCAGEIFVDLPVHYGGVDIRGIYLKLVEGEIVEYSAEEGQDQLAAIIETDEGSKRLGEVALGMNPGLDRVIKNPLFVEKVGGTLHIAIGASYDGCFVEDPDSPEGKAELKRLEEAGILNKSAQHVDIVTDFRSGGCGRRVTVGRTRLEVRDGLWVPAI